MFCPPSVLYSLPHAQLTAVGTCAPLWSPVAPCPKGQLAAFSAAAVKERGSQPYPRLPGLAGFALHSASPFSSWQSLSGGWVLPERDGFLLKPL